MVRKIKYFGKHRPDDSDHNSLLDEERSLYSVSAEDKFDDLLAGLINRPDVAPKEPAQARLPSVEDFRPEDCAAINMASKLVPDQKPPIKSRRPRYRSPNRDRRRIPDEQNDECSADSWDLPRAIGTRRDSGRGLFWSFCTSILIVLSTSAAFGFVQPLNDLLPKRIGDFLSGISEDLSASLLNRADTSADFEVADGNPNSDKSLLIQAQPIATAADARAVSITSIAAKFRPSANSSESGFAEQAELTDAAAARAAAADAGIEENPRRPALQPSVKANPLQVTNTAQAVTQEPVTNEPQPVTSPLSAAQIERLLARGEELMQSGDIASARLLFQRVAAAGDGRGAVGIGMTYDPDFYARLPVTGLTPDRKQAEFWYKKVGEDWTFTTDPNTVPQSSN